MANFTAREYNKIKRYVHPIKAAGTAAFIGCFLVFRERTGYPMEQLWQTFRRKAPAGLPGRPEQNAVPRKGDNMALARAGKGFQPPAYYIFIVHTAASFKGAAVFFSSTHFCQFPNQITKGYIIFITGAPAILRVRLFFVFSCIYFLFRVSDEQPTVPLMICLGVK